MQRPGASTARRQRANASATTSANKIMADSNNENAGKANNKPGNEKKRNDELEKKLKEMQTELGLKNHELRMMKGKLKDAQQQSKKKDNSQVPALNMASEHQCEMEELRSLLKKTQEERDNFKEETKLAHEKADQLAERNVELLQELKKKDALLTARNSSNLEKEQGNICIDGQSTPINKMKHEDKPILSGYAAYNGKEVRRHATFR